MRRLVADLRSDTVTLPLRSMLDAVSSSALGDDVFGDDPTVNLLEREAATLLGKEAALFVVSGTMGNLLAVMSHCEAGRGSEMIVGDKSHIALYEGGSSASLAGVFSRLVPTEHDGTIALSTLRGAVQTPDIHHTVTRLICLENTHNDCGGVPVSKEYTDQVGALAREHGLKVHMDGARLFNAAAALNCSAKDLVSSCDSVMFCLSKGLAAPVGSMLVGDKKFVEKARYFRKMLGGGMRQAGVIAGPGLVALREMPSRLHRDHEMAKRLAQKLRDNKSIEMEYVPKSNMMHFRLKHSNKKSIAQIEAELKEKGILVCGDESRWRLVTHYAIDEDAVDQVAAAFDEVLNK